MIRVYAGGKPPKNWQKEGLEEYTRRLRAPFDARFEFFEEAKLEKMLLDAAFYERKFVILLDERGKNLSSVEFSAVLRGAWNRGLGVAVVIGGAYGFSEEARRRADLVLSYGVQVFPHELMRILVAEQIYRAQEIDRGSGYHHV